MTPIGPLVDQKNFHLMMVAIHRSWALDYMRRGQSQKAKMQFRAAQRRLDEARAARLKNSEGCS
jgi:hypothetical protein